MAAKDVQWDSDTVEATCLGKQEVGKGFRVILSCCRHFNLFVISGDISKLFNNYFFEDNSI